MVRRMVKIFCIRHDESVPSLVIYSDHAYCYACKYRFTLKEIEDAIGYIPVQSEKPKRIYKPITSDIDESTEVKQFLRSRNINALVARIYGVKSTPNGLYLPCYDFDGKLWGYQIRNLNGEPKYINNTLRDIYLGYSACISNSKFRVVIVESIIDALSLVSREPLLEWIALLGTTLKPEVIQNIIEYKNIYIYFDPDAFNNACYMHDVFKSHDVDSIIINNGKKPYGVSSIDEIY